MGKITEVVVTKGKTVKTADREEWLKLEFSVKAEIDDNVELAEAKSHIEGLIDGWLSNLLVAKPQEQKRAKPGPEIFSEDLRQLLTFEEKEGFLIIKPRQFLGSENFAKIADVVRGAGGEYISNGKQSHFRIPLKISY
ncbi:MAG: hypothetical protein QXL91_03720 [Candidatus Bathyarchaeia archaeon]